MMLVMKYLLFIKCYCINNYPDKQKIIDNLNKMKEIGINEFELCIGENFDGKYIIKIQENINESTMAAKKYCIQGYCTDTPRQNIEEIESGVYAFDIKKAKYIIKYIKGSLSQDKVIMKVNSLNFDKETLPKKEELYNISVLPNIDFIKIKQQKQVVDFNFQTQITISQAQKLLKESEQLLIQFRLNNLTKESATISSQLETVKLLIENLKRIEEEQIAHQLNNMTITKAELHTLTKRKITKKKIIN